MGLWDTVTDWFTKKEKYEIDEAKKNKEEQELLDKLGELDSVLYKEDDDAYKQGQELAKPVEEEFEYVDVDTTTDDEIHNSVKDKYKDDYVVGQEAIEKDYSKKEQDKLGIADDVKQKAESKEEKLNQEKMVHSEKSKNKAIESGLRDSTIATTQQEVIEDNAQLAMSELDKSTQKQLDKLDSDIEYLNEMKEQAKGNHSSSMTKKIDAEIASLTKSRDSLIEKQTKQNQNTELNQKKYEKKLATAQEKFKADWNKRKDDRNLAESKGQFNGRRKDNYDERVRLATEYYLQYPKEVALQLLSQNESIQKMLGGNMYLVKHAINNAK